MFALQMGNISIQYIKLYIFLKGFVMEKIKNFLAPVLKTRLTLGFFISILCVFVLSGLLTGVMFLLQPDAIRDVAINIIRSNLLNFILNFAIVFLPMLLLFFAFNNVGVAAGIVSIFIISLSLANRFKMLLRNDPLFPWELNLGAEVIAIAGGFQTLHIVLVILLVIGMILGTILLYFVIKTKKVKPLYRVACVLVIAVVMHLLNSSVYRDVALNNSIPVRGNVFNHADVFNSRGFLYSFVFAHNTQRISMPADFDRAPINAIEANFVPLEITDDIVRPHIIMIMSEAFSDMPLNPYVSFDDFDYHPLYYWQQLIEKDATIHGQLIVPNSGGGTGDTEFDVLTGLNTRSLRGAPFSYRLVNHYFEAMPHLLDELGYRSIAMHPGFRWFYNRQNVYRFFGFEHFYCMEYFDWEVHRKGMYISDWATMDKLMDIWHRHLEDHPGMPLFSFTVTIQNHGPYTDIYGIEQNFSTSLNLSPAEINPVSNYFHGVRDNDVELWRLIQYFEHHDEPVVLVYFSDHMPAFAPNIYDEFLPNIHPDGSFESRTRLNRVPFMIWQNESARTITPIEENFQLLTMPDDMIIGSSFLGAYVMELLGFTNLSPLFDFVNDLRTTFPVVLEDRSISIDGEYSIYMDEDLRQPLRIYRHWNFDRVLN